MVKECCPEIEADHKSMEGEAGAAAPPASLLCGGGQVSQAWSCGPSPPTSRSLQCDWRMCPDHADFQGPGPEGCAQSRDRSRGQKQEPTQDVTHLDCEGRRRGGGALRVLGAE